jgi:CRISPR-associated protein Csx10
VAAILDWLTRHLEANARRRDRWPNGSIESIRQFLTDTQRLWNTLNPSAWPTLTANAQTELRRDLWALAVRTFFDACIRAHKRELEVASGA